MIDETKITRMILENAVKDIIDSLDIDVAIAGGGPAGLVAAKYLADGGASVSLFERKLSVGGGMWGGGMMFPKIIVQEEAKGILDDFGINYIEDKDIANQEFTINDEALDSPSKQYVANSIESVAKLTSNAIDSGAKIFNAISVEDVMIRENEITGFVINWSAVDVAGFHVDPLTIASKFSVDATGHPAEVCHITQRKVGKLNTPSGEVEGECSMWARKSEILVVENTREIYPNLYVAGMAANAVFGAPRMGPIFGGMLLSGRKVAEIILERL